MACDRQRTKEGSKEVTFLSIEIDTELLDVLKRSKVRFSVFWLTQTETSENLGVGTYMLTFPRLSNANVRS